MPRPSKPPRPSCCRRSRHCRPRKPWSYPLDGSSRSERSRCSPIARANCDLGLSPIVAPISSASRSRQSETSLPQRSLPNFSHPGPGAAGSYAFVIVHCRNSDPPQSTPKKVSWPLAISPPTHNRASQTWRAARTGLRTWCSPTRSMPAALFSRCSRRSRPVRPGIRRICRSSSGCAITSRRSKRSKPSVSPANPCRSATTKPRPSFTRTACGPRCSALIRGLSPPRGTASTSSPNPALAALCKGVVEGAGEAIGTYVLARREFGADYWKVVNQAYAVSEARAAARETVADLSGESSPMAAYAEVLMLQLSQPQHLSHRELGWTRRWVRRWAHKAVLSREAPERGAYAVDIAKDSGPAWVNSSAGPATLRFLDLTPVGRPLDPRIQRLDAGAEPAAPRLGSDCTRLAAQDLLKTLRGAWLDSPPARDFPRRESPSPIELVSGFAAIHHAIEGNPTAANSAGPSSYSYGEDERLHVFQGSETRDAREQSLESWETLEESHEGFKLRRRTPGMRLAHRQLVALRPRGARQFILCHVDWLAEGPEPALSSGARALQSVAKARAVRPPAPTPPKRARAL